MTKINECDYKKIIDLYVREKKSTVEISKMFNVSHLTINYTLRKNNIKIRDNSECQKGKKLSYNHKKKISKKLKNREFSEETRKKISIAGKKRIRTKEEIERLRERGKMQLGKTYEEIHGEKMAKEIKKKIGRKLDKNSNWRGGKSFEKYGRNFSLEFKNLIRKRDNQICMVCGIHREKIKRAFDIHHINYNKKLTIPQNCISLCYTCHGITHFNREYWTKFFQSLLSERYGYEYKNGDIVINLPEVNPIS